MQLCCCEGPLFLLLTSYEQMLPFNNWLGDLSGCVKSSENHKDVAMREDHESSDQKDLVKGSQRLGANVRCKILYTGKELDRLVAESC